MRAKTCVWLLWTLCIACGYGYADHPDPQTRMKGVVRKYMEMPGDPSPGVAVEISEFVDRERTMIALAETEIIAALQKAGVPVLEKGKPEYIVYGAVESNWSGVQSAYGTPLFIYEAVITLKVIDTRKGTVLDTASAQVRKVGPSPEKAAREAIQEAGSAAGKKVAEILEPRTRIVE